MWCTDVAFKQDPNKKARLADLNKTVLIKTVRTLQRRETKLLNEIAKLEHQVNAPEAEIDAVPSLDTVADVRSHLGAVEFGYRAGEKGADNLEMTLHRWAHPIGDADAVVDWDQVERDNSRGPAPGKGQLVGLPFPWEKK